MKVRLTILLLGLILLSICYLRRVRESSSPNPVSKPPPALREDAISDSVDTCGEEVAESREHGQPEITTPLEVSVAEGRTSVTRPTVVEILIELAHMQNPDGSWGDKCAFLGDNRLDRAGLTGLAIVAFLKEGYSHLSKDVYDECEFGSIVKKGLKWLLRNQQEDGTFPSGWSGPVDQALASWALSEAYGMSATQLFKAPAQLSVDALSARFRESIRRNDESSAAWMSFALMSARLSELDIPEGLVEEGLDYFGRKLAWTEGLMAAAGWSALGGAHGAAGLRPAAERAVQQLPDFEQPDFLGWYLKSAALDRCRGSDRRMTEAWGRRARESTSAAWARAKVLQSWNRSEDVVRASLLVFNLEYRAWPVTACDCCRKSEEQKGSQFPDPEPE